MVTYLFMYVMPTVAECCVTFVIFYLHFHLPALSAICSVTFLLYCWLTVSITEWRKQFREGMNKSDNEIHDKVER